MKKLALIVLAIVAAAWDWLTTPAYVVKHTGLRYGVKTAGVNAAISTQGFKLEVDTSAAPHSAPAYVEVSQITDIPDVAQVASDLDASNLQSVKKDYIAGLQDSSAVDLTGQRVVLDAGQNFLRDNAGAIAAVPFRNTYSDGAILTYSATIKSFAVTGNTDQVQMFKSSIRPSGDQVWSGTGGPTT